MWRAGRTRSPREQVQTLVLALPEHPAGGERLRSRSRLPEAARRRRRQPRRSLARLRRRSHRVLGRAARQCEARSRRSRHRAEVHRAFHRRSAPAVPRAWRRTRRQRRARAGVRTGRLRQRSSQAITVQPALGVGQPADRAAQSRRSAVCRGAPETDRRQALRIATARHSRRSGRSSRSSLRRKRSSGRIPTSTRRTSVATSAWSTIGWRLVGSDWPRISTASSSNSSTMWRKENEPWQKNQRPIGARKRSSACAG